MHQFTDGPYGAWTQTAKLQSEGLVPVRTRWKLGPFDSGVEYTAEIIFIGSVPDE
jgi:hypothetical protein